MAMKIYAFVRSNVPKVLRGKCNGKIIEIPHFSKFLYFIHAPTLVYRDGFPRSERVRWSFVIYRVLEIVCLLLFTSFCFADGIIPLLKGFCTRKYRFSEILLLCCQVGIYGGWVIWSIGIIMLHTTQNIVGEILRFRDRSFYADWWSCSNYRQYFRKWNMLVGDWLLIYVYKDFYESITPGRATFAKLVLFTLSILAHEWLIFNVVGFILPVCAVLFFSGALLSLLPFPKRSNALNVLFLFNHSFGTGIIFAFVLSEHYARVNQHLLDSAGLTPVMFTKCIEW